MDSPEVGLHRNDAAWYGVAAHPEPPPGEALIGAPVLSDADEFEASFLASPNPLAHRDVTPISMDPLGLSGEPDNRLAALAPVDGPALIDDPTLAASDGTDPISRPNESERIPSDSPAPAPVEPDPLAAAAVEPDPLAAAVLAPAKAEPAVITVAKKTNRSACSAFKDFALGIVRSKIFRATVITIAAVIGFLFLFGTPVGWMILAVAACAFAFWLLCIGVQSITDKGQKVSFEFTAIKRLFKSKNYDEIKLDVRLKGKIFLGALPNRLKNDGEHLVNSKETNVTAVLSVNEGWELKPYGLSNPYTTADWKNLGVTDHCCINARDHHLLSPEALNRAADFINGCIEKGQNVYVHCRAGVGRSGMAIAAYLIKYQGMTPEQAAQAILSSRPSATINNKLADKGDEKGLNSFYNIVHPESPLQLAPNSHLPEAM